MDVTVKELKTWLKSALFIQNPSIIAVIDRSHNIVDANKNFQDHFGLWRNKKCYEVYKKLSRPCDKCQAVQSFEDGDIRTYEDEGINVNGEITHYLVHSVPVINDYGKVEFIIERSQDITEIWQREREHTILFEQVPCYIAVLDSNLKIVRANNKLRQTFGICLGKYCYEVYKKRDRKCDNCPAIKTLKDGKEHTATHVGISREGKETHYAVISSPLHKGNIRGDQVIEILTDITDIKMLEKEKITAERLAAVGQTVAGLSHSVKNILMGVEGGMYMVGSGIKKDDRQIIAEGWDMLKRNISKVSSLVKDFLSFSKGRKPDTQLVDPNDLVNDIYNLYKDTAKKIGVNLERNPRKNIDPAQLDPDGIHTCLTNLVSNAIDACQMSSKDFCTVKLDVYDKDHILVFDVSDDGCGLDYSIKEKVFTTFFTTKGGKGTGLGLLTTRKIVQEHGGKVIVESLEGKGSIFRIELPRNQLPDPETN
ncbi:MAG: ATP-binding protein [Chitinispirillia bacterium]|jgi:PAS domain S-box-containing protein